MYLLGLSTVLISSKYEDPVSITMTTLLEKAGYNKFTAKQVVQQEQDVLLAIAFKVHNSESDHFCDAMILFKDVLSKAEKGQKVTMPKDLLKEAEQLVAFLSHLAVFSLEPLSY